MIGLIHSVQSGSIPLRSLQFSASLVGTVIALIAVRFLIPFGVGFTVCPFRSEFRLPSIAG
ncbi:hypothetical protein [Holdemania massiliensis]|jgi:hypothetical protein|uniref:hypothetical protein n=1 Tax=Holdemania massiliensis TaxID=1468449 RepID=UPI0019D6732F|nr:hypothetical protein [Holdemania massiliensis]